MNTDKQLATRLATNRHDLRRFWPWIEYERLADCCFLFFNRDLVVFSGTALGLRMLRAWFRQGTAVWMQCVFLRTLSCFVPVFIFPSALLLSVLL
jgi:hypothetical protein